MILMSFLSLLDGGIKSLNSVRFAVRQETRRMKSNFPLILACIWFLIAAVGGCGWREVKRGEEINYDWDSQILEVKTEEMSSLLNGDKQLEIVFDTEKKTGEIVLKFWSFHLTQSDYNENKEETLNFVIMFQKKNRNSWTNKPPGELRWTFKKNRILNMIQVGLAGTFLEENLELTNEDRTKMFRFTSGDNISLLYRVNSADGDDDCVKPGNKNTRDTMIMF